LSGGLRLVWPVDSLLMPPHRARRRFSQNFLVDRNVIDRIVRAIDPKPGEHLLEIGPGFGALTAPLLERALTLQAVEIDRDAVRALQERFPADRLHVHCGDALKLDFASFGTGLRIVGNLPYHVSTLLLFRIDTASRFIRDCHFMLQKEVVDRMAAAPDTHDYGRLSVMLQYRWRIEPLFEVGPGSFRPQPKVRSAVVRMLPSAEPPHRAKDEAMFARVVTAAFGKRRKTLRNALREYLSEADLAGIGIDPQLRAETLGVEQFVRAADACLARLSVSSG
jgi:16S rRNA (adenine1518-N6/adenine1519-N6)-dimethyltransferase